MRRLVCSISALAAFSALALGSGESTPELVKVTYDGPAKLNVGEKFPFRLRISNEGDSVYVIEEVTVSADIVRAIAATVPSALSSEPYGAETRYKLTPVQVLPGGGAVIDLEGTPYLDGESGNITVCDAGGRCHKVWISNSVVGGAPDSLHSTWTLPVGATVGQPAIIKVEVQNVSGGPETIRALGWSDSLNDKMAMQSSQPPHKGNADEMLSTAWLFGVRLEPGEVTSVELTVVPNALGNTGGDFVTCLESETFCKKQKLSFQVQ